VIFPISAYDSSGYLICYLPVPDNSLTSSPGSSINKVVNEENTSLHLQALTDVAKRESSERHFEIYSPSYVLDADQTNRLLNSFEKAYGIYKGLGFKFEDSRTWPMKIEVKDYGPDYRGGHVYLSNSYSWIRVNSQFLTDESLCTYFFYYVAAQYDPGHWLLRIDNNPEHYWINVAVKTWSLEKVVTDPESFESPPDWVSHFTSPFEGLHKTPSQNPIHGFGMAALIKYLVENYGENIIVKIYDKIKAGKHVIKAITENVPDPSSFWIEKFFRDLSLGNIYPHSFLSNNIYMKSVATMDKDNKTYVFTENYPDLSAKMYKMLINYDDFSNNSYFNFQINGGVNSHITLNKLNLYDQSTEFIGAGLNHVRSPNVSSLEKQKYCLVAIVINNRNIDPYSDEIPITLKIEKLDDVVFTGCNVYLNWLHGDFIFEYNDGSTDPYNDFQFQESFIKKTESAKVTFENNILTQEYENFTDIHGSTYTSKIVVQFRDETSSYITSLNAHFKEVHSAGNSTETTLSVSNIPKIEIESRIRFKLEGEEMCSNITELSQTRLQSNGKFTLVNGSQKCYEYSYIEVDILK